MRARARRPAPVFYPPRGQDQASRSLEASINRPVPHTITHVHLRQVSKTSVVEIGRLARFLARVIHEFGKRTETVGAREGAALCGGERDDGFV